MMMSVSASFWPLMRFVRCWSSNCGELLFPKCQCVPRASVIDTKIHTIQRRLLASVQTSSPVAGAFHQSRPESHQLRRGPATLSRSKKKLQFRDLSWQWRFMLLQIPFALDMKQGSLHKQTAIDILCLRVQLIRQTDVLTHL